MGLFPGSSTVLCIFDTSTISVKYFLSATQSKKKWGGGGGEGNFKEEGRERRERAEKKINTDEI